jgi:hypothetical protein
MNDPVTYGMEDVLSGACELTTEQQESEMSEGYHAGDSNYGYDAQPHTWNVEGPVDKVVDTPKVEGVRDIRRVLDEIKVYADKLTADVKIPRATVKDWVKRLEAVSK